MNKHLQLREYVIRKSDGHGVRLWHDERGKHIPNIINGITLSESACYLL